MYDTSETILPSMEFCWKISWDYDHRSANSVYRGTGKWKIPCHAWSISRTRIWIIKGRYISQSNLKSRNVCICYMHFRITCFLVSLLFFCHFTAYNLTLLFLMSSILCLIMYCKDYYGVNGVNIWLQLCQSHTSKGLFIKSNFTCWLQTYTAAFSLQAV